MAAASGFDEVCRFLILEGADVNCRDNFGVTPLLEALRAGHDITAKLLKEKGAIVNLQVKETGTWARGKQRLHFLLCSPARIISEDNLTYWVVTWSH